MTKEELIQWFNDEFWEQYQEMVKAPFPTKYKAGAKGEALKRLITIDPSEKLRQRIASAVTEQRRHRKKLYDHCGSMQKYLERVSFDKFYANRGGSAWLNQMGWEDEIPILDFAQIEHDQVFGGNRCKVENCVFPIHGPDYEYCAEHLTKTGEHNETLRIKLREMDLGKSKDESVHDYAMRCKDKALKLMRGLNNAM